MNDHNVLVSYSTDYYDIFLYEYKIYKGTVLLVQGYEYDDEEESYDKIKQKIINNLTNYLKKPDITKYSKLMNKVINDVMASENLCVFIEKEDFDYMNFGLDDLIKFENECKTLKLHNIVETNDYDIQNNDVIITCYGDFRTIFNFAYRHCELKIEINRKIHEEFDQFIDVLKQSDIDTIIYKSYEKVYKEEIVMILENLKLDDDKLKKLNSMTNILDNLYDWWLSSSAIDNESLINEIEFGLKEK